MTELNETREPEAAQPAPEWPEAAADVGDPPVQGIVTTLGRLQALPVAEHEAVYGGLHDALLESLNEDAPAGNGVA